MSDKKRLYTNFDFMGKRKLWMAISCTFVIISIISFVTRGLNLGIDFTGGTQVEVGYSKSVKLDGVRTVLSTSQFKDAVVQYFGSAKDVLIRVAPRKDMNSATISNQIINLLKSKGQKVEVRRVEFVGPQVGGDLVEDGGLSMIYTLFGILVYVALRFQMRFSLGAIVATIHDTVVTFGFFSLTGMEFDLTVLAAILAVIGYSLNDTIVVFDRIRENFHKLRKAVPVEVLNVSINQTLSRTLMTSGLTLMVVVVLFFYGGEIIHGFATALIVGIVVGTYSSIYIASPITLALGVSRKDLLPVEKEGAAVDNRP